MSGAYSVGRALPGRARRRPEPRWVDAAVGVACVLAHLATVLIIGIGFMP
jgi:hypothetical protein